MSLTIQPAVGGELGLNAKNMYTGRSTVVLASVTPQMVLDAGLEEGDVLHLTDDTGVADFYKIGAAGALDAFSTGTASGDVTGPGSSTTGHLATFGDTSGKNIVDGGPVPSTAGLAPLASPTFTGTVAGITKAMVGLGSVDNTSDASKPISTLTQSALDDKAPLASPTFTGTVAGITKAMVGLGSVDNITDAAKPISTLTQSALDDKAPIASPSFTGTVKIPTAVAPTVGQFASAKAVDGEIEWVAAPSGVSAVDWEDEGVNQGAGDTLNVTGAGATLTFAAGVATIDVPAVGSPAFVDITGNVTDNLNLAGELDDKADEAYTNPNSYYPVADDTVTELWESIGKAMTSVGHVKINGRGGVKPNYSLTAGAAEIQMDYTQGTGALDISSSPTTTYPKTNPPSDCILVDHTAGTIIENAVLGQTHTWRLLFSFTKLNNDKPTFYMRIANDQNPASSFSETQSVYIDKAQASGEITMLFTTTADNVSIPPPVGDPLSNGYNMYVSCSSKDITVTLESIARTSLAVQPF